MADLPRYQSKTDGQPITPDPQNAAAIKEVQSGADRLSSALQSFSNAGMHAYYDQATLSAKQAGEQAGSQPGFKPSQPYTQADMVYQNAALEANKASVQLDISGNLQRLRDQVLDPKNFGPDALNKYNQLASAYQEGAFAAIPKEVMPSAKHYFDYYNQQSQSAINSRVDTLTRNQLQFQLFDYLNTTGKQASNAAFGGDHDAASALTNQAVQKLDAAVSTGLISGAQAAHLKNGYVTQEHQDFYLGQFSHLLNSDPTKAAGFISDFLHSDSVDMNPLEKMKMVTHMHAMWKQYELQQGLDGINLSQQKKSAIAGIQNGEPPSKYASIDAQVQAFDPGGYPKYAAEKQAAELSYAGEQALMYTDTATGQQFLSQHKPSPFLADGVTPNPAYAELMSVWNHLGDSIKKLDKQWKDDPAGMAMKNPSVTKAVEDHNTAASGPNGKVQSVSRGTINPVDAMVNVQRARGVAPEDISVMPSSIAASTVAQLKGMDLPKQLETLQGLFDQYGAQYAPELSRDLQKAGLGVAPLRLVAMANNQQSKGQLPSAIKAMQTSSKDIEKMLPVGASMKDIQKSVSGALSEWNASMQSYSGDTTKYRAETQADVAHYAAYLLSSGETKDPTSAAQMAADAFINNFYSYAKFNGYKAAIPKQYDSGLVNDAFTHLWKEAQDAQLKVPRLYGSTFHTLTNDGLQKQYKADSISQAHLAVEPGDAGAVLVDNQGSPITTTDGRKFSFKFDDLGNAFSDIRTHIDTRKVGEQQRVLNQAGLGFSTPESLGAGEGKATTLGNGMTGHFVPGKFETKSNDASQTPRQLFVETDKDGNEKGSYYFDPKGKFTDMTKGKALDELIADPDTFDKSNPSNFEPKIYDVLQRFKSNPEGLRKYFKDHPDVKLYKQETTR